MRITLFALRRSEAKQIEDGGTGTSSQVVVPCSDGSMTVRENIAGHVLASLTTQIWNVPSKARTGGTPTADASLNRWQTMRVGAGVAFAQAGIVGFDGQIELEALRLFGLPEAAPAVLYAGPAVPVGRAAWRWKPPGTCRAWQRVRRRTSTSPCLARGAGTSAMPRSTLAASPSCSTAMPGRTAACGSRRATSALRLSIWPSRRCRCRSRSGGLPNRLFLLKFLAMAQNQTFFVHIFDLNL